ncbi:MAG: glycosyltransferase [Planctomycetota bacterium]
MRLQICHLVTSFDTGGLQNGIVNLCNYGSDSSFRHTILSLQAKDGMKARLRRGDVRTLDFDGGRKLSAYRAIAAVLRDIKPDILHTRNWGTWPDGILAARAASISACIHGYHGRDLSNANSESMKRRMIGRGLSAATKRVVCLSESMKTEFRRDFGTSEKKIRIIPNGVDLKRMEGPVADPELASSFSVCTLGRLDAVKNIPLLIRAFAQMKTRMPSDRLWIVGEGPERARLESLIEQSALGDSVHVLKERNDVAAVMKSAQVYVQPSFYEGMSNTIVEAMSIGLPVIATEVGGNADVSGGEGYAILVPSDDSAAMASALDRLRDDAVLRERLGRAARVRVRGRFTIPKMVTAYESLYEEVAQS